MRVYIGKLFYLFLIRNICSGYSKEPYHKTYVVGTQKNRLNETFFFEHPKHMFWMRNKENSYNFSS